MLQMSVQNGGMKYGYARVSTDDQTPALQLAALKKAGCKTIFKDDGLIRNYDQAPRPATLPQETRTRRHTHSVEARPIRPRLRDLGNALTTHRLWPAKQVVRPSAPCHFDA
jgi:hypothetical protein